MNESCLVYEWVLSHIWTSHVSHMSTAGQVLPGSYTYRWVMSHIWMCLVSCIIYQRVMSHIWVRLVKFSRVLLSKEPYLVSRNLVKETYPQSRESPTLGQESTILNQKRPMLFQKSLVLKKLPYFMNIDLFWFKRALRPVNSAMYVIKRAIYLIKRSVYVIKRCIYSIQSCNILLQQLFKSAVYAIKWATYSNEPCIQQDKEMYARHTGKKVLPSTVLRRHT